MVNKSVIITELAFEKLKKHCNINGIKMGFFVSKLIIDELEKGKVKRKKETETHKEETYVCDCGQRWCQYCG